MLATKSKDGLLRYTMRVEHRIGRDWLVAFVADRIANHGVVLITQHKILEAAREELKTSGGDSVWYWSDDVKDFQDVEAAATRIVDKAFPKL